MARDHFNLRCICYILLLLSSSFSSFIFLYWSYFSNLACHGGRSGGGNTEITMEETINQDFNLLKYPSAWNLLHLATEEPPPKHLKIALFVKKWPEKNHAGGLERHAATLHCALAERGHDLHIFTTSSANHNLTSIRNLHFHLSKPTAGGYLDQATIWEQFQLENSTGKPFDVVHTESVGLMHTRSRYLTNLAVSWHGIAYESIHSDIIQETLRPPDDRAVQSSPLLKERVSKVVEEIKFFPRYAHHVATSDHVGDILKRVYMLPEERVHIILNGVNQEIFKPGESPETGEYEFKFRCVRECNKSLILGIAGRLVRDKGHPLIFEALKQILNESSTFRDSVVVLVVGDGPWGDRYKELGSNIHVLGPLEQSQLAKFYNAIDIFVNPTLRAQGLDHTLLEAMLVGKPLMATRLASITGSVIISRDIGYTFSPTVDTLKKALYDVWRDGKDVLQKKGGVARKRALQLFTATKMVAAYERLFLCIAQKENGGNLDYCTYNHDSGRRS